MNVWLLRLVFFLYTWIGGLGALTYAALWIFVPLGDASEQRRSAPRPQVRLILLALLAVVPLTLDRVRLRIQGKQRDTFDPGAELATP